MKITIDDREPNKLISLCEKNNMDVTIKRLKVGDYVCEDICIERKQIDDFCSSIMDGRLKNQIKNMKKKYKHNYVLVSGIISKRHNYDFHEHSILGMIVSIVVKNQVNVLLLEDEKQLVYTMQRIFTKHKEMIEIIK